MNRTGGKVPQVWALGYAEQGMNQTVRENGILPSSLYGI